MRHKVAIIGAGRIAAGFDTPGADRVLTHAHAVRREPRLELLGFWDISEQVSLTAAERWGTSFYKSLDALLERSPDLVVVAVPDEVHEIYLRRLADYSPRLVICEKPLTRDIDSARAVVRLYAEQKIPLLVNFQRRFDSTVIELQSRFIRGELGRVIGGTVWYSKGAKHNGSHAIDLLRFLFANPIRINAHGHVVDYCETDPTVSGRIDFDAFSIHLMAADERLFSIFEIDLIFERSRYSFTHSGLNVEIQEPQEDPVFQGYTELAVVRSCPTGLSQSMEKLMNAAADYLDGGVLPGNTAEDALATQAICDKLVELVREPKSAQSCPV